MNGKIIYARIRLNGGILLNLLVIEGGYLMKMLDDFKRVAEKLASGIETVWTNYDFDEKSNIPNERVPQISFNEDVFVMFDEAMLVKRTGRVDSYMRECQIKYDGEVYIFEIFACINEDEIVTAFRLSAYIPASDGKGGKRLLFSEVIV